MTQIIELQKGEFFTIEAFTFTLEDGIIYEGERDEDLDTYWYDNEIFEGQQLMEYTHELCVDCLKDNVRIVDVIARRYATIVDGFVNEYGDDTCDNRRYIWTGKQLLTVENYISSELLTSKCPL